MILFEKNSQFNPLLIKGAYVNRTFYFINRKSLQITSIFLLSTNSNLKESLVMLELKLTLKIRGQQEFNNKVEKYLYCIYVYVSICIPEME